MTDTGGSAIMPTLDRIAAQLSEIADFVKALDHDTKIKFLADHIDAFNEIGKQHRRTVAVLNAADRKRQKDAIAAKQKASTETDVAATMSASQKDKGVFQ